MSLAGLKQFEKNLQQVMKTELFKRSDHVQQMKIGERLMKSSYGGVFGTRVKDLEPKS